MIDLKQRERQLIKEEEERKKNDKRTEDRLTRFITELREQEQQEANDGGKIIEEDKEKKPKVEFSIKETLMSTKTHIFKNFRFD
jgi:hypothetical protein